MVMEGKLMPFGDKGLPTFTFQEEVQFQRFKEHVVHRTGGWSSTLCRASKHRHGGWQHLAPSLEGSRRVRMASGRLQGLGMFSGGFLL